MRHPKITSYSENLKGNELPATIDIHALGLPVMLAGAGEFLKREYRAKLEAGKLSMTDALKHPAYWRNPYPNEYAALEQFYKRLAKRANLTPAEVQAAAWMGGGHITGVRSNSLWTSKPHFYDRLRRTAEKTGLSEEEVFDLLVDGKLDLVLGDEQSNPVA